MQNTGVPPAQSPSRVGAVLLAAGAGARMGYRPKSLLELEGVPLIRRQILALLEAGTSEIVVVLGHHADVIEPALQGLPVAVVHNPDPAAGPVNSQRLGLAHMSPGLDLIIMALADQPLVGAPEVRQLMQAFASRPSGTHLVFPQHHGQPGNPVLLSPEVRDAILVHPQQIGCRQWRDAHASQVHAWPCESIAFSLDLDTPDDISHFVHATGRRLTWPASLQGGQGRRHDLSDAGLPDPRGQRR